MNKTERNRRGQFIIIAVLMIAIMLVSVGALLHGAVTYYKHEPWEEYSTLIGDIELGARRLVELSLVTHTHDLDATVLSDNLAAWQKDLLRIYPSLGITLNYDIDDTNGGLFTDWNKPVSYSNASSDFMLNIASIGLDGYRFTAMSSLKMQLYDQTIDTTSGQVTVKAVITDEDNLPVGGLKKENFKVNNGIPLQASPSLHSQYKLIYTIVYQGPPGAIEVWDTRGIHVIGLL